CQFYVDDGGFRNGHGDVLEHAFPEAAGRCAHLVEARGQERHGVIARFIRRDSSRGTGSVTNDAHIRSNEHCPRLVSDGPGKPARGLTLSKLGRAEGSNRQKHSKAGGQGSCRKASTTSAPWVP